MSRCFPFPPPGYQSKPRPDDVNLIIKEKKKKKHKDRKEKSERKEKERSEGKHKEDKKRKRNKAKDEKDKKKDNVSSSVEKKIVGFLENPNGEKLVANSKPTDRIQVKRTFPELEKGVAYDGGASDNQVVRNITLVKKSEVNLLGHLQESRNGQLASRIDNGQSLGVDARSLQNGLVGNCNGEERKDTNGYRKKFGGGDGYEKEERNKYTKVEVITRKEEEKKERVTGDSRENIKRGETDVKEGLNGFLHGNGSWPNNVSRPALPCHQAVQNGSGFRPPQNTGNLSVEKRAVITNQKVNGKLSSPQTVITNVRNMEHCQTTNKPVSELNNGVISSQLVHNKRKNDTYQISNGIATVKPVVTSCIPNEKSRLSQPLLENGGKMNGTLEGKECVSSRPSSAKIKAKDKSHTSKKPHPDLKYLGQILSVPQVEWAQFDDDQEWLFGCNGSQAKRPKLGSPQNQVWSKAIQLEPVDVTALPYVIPY